MAKARAKKTTRSTRATPAKKTAASARAKKTTGGTRSPRKKMGYDATDGNKRRKAPSTKVQSEDKVLTDTKRKKVITGARDLQRNFTAAAWAIRQHLNHITAHHFQARTGDPGLDREVEALMAWWSRPPNCDVAGRHSLQRIVRLAEARAVVDGDVFVLKLKSGMLQAIEGDRVATPTKDLPPDFKKDEWTHGVRTDQFGRAKEICVCARKGQGLAYQRTIRAGFVVHHGFFDRFDQVRGISPLTAAINPFRDIYESLDFALAKLKISQLFGLVFYRAGADQLAQTTGSGEGQDEQPATVDFSKGPTALDMDQDDKVEILESQTPSTASQDFSQQMIALALKALDIPMSFFREDFTNYSGARQALLQYDLSARQRRDQVRGMMDGLTRWRMNKFVGDGDLKLPAGKTGDDLRWEWIPEGMAWIDPLKEVTADLKAVDGKIRTRTQILRGQGLDFRDVAEQLAEEEKLLNDLGLVVAPVK